MLFDQAERKSLSCRRLAPYEHTDLRPVFTQHKHLHDPRLQVLEFTDCIVSRDGFLRLKSGEVLTDIAYEAKLPQARKALEQAHANPANIQTIEEPVILIGGHNNYYHWHLNWMPRIMLADRFEDLRALPLLIHAQPADYVLESLKQATGRDASDLKMLTGPAIRLKRAFVPSMFLNPIHAPFALRGYQHLRRQSAKNAGRRIYISRANAPLRRVINEAEIEAMLRDYGFETVVAEDLGYSEQVELFSQASHIVAAHGAGLANILFCSPGVSVIEMFNDYYTKVYWSLAQAIGSTQYRQVRGYGMIPPEGETDEILISKNSDFMVDPKVLKAEVEKILT